jgi:hypothetical protein
MLYRGAGVGPAQAHKLAQLAVAKLSKTLEAHRMKPVPCTAPVEPGASGAKLRSGLQDQRLVMRLSCPCECRVASLKNPAAAFIHKGD